MSRKYNTKHPNRGISNYPERLRKRGLGKTPVMVSLEILKRWQRDTPPPAADSYAGWEVPTE